MKKIKNILTLASLLTLTSTLGCNFLSSCGSNVTANNKKIEILNGDSLTLDLGDETFLSLSTKGINEEIKYESSNENVIIIQDKCLKAIGYGEASVKVFAEDVFDTILVKVIENELLKPSLVIDCEKNIRAGLYETLDISYSVSNYKGEIDIKVEDESILKVKEKLNNRVSFESFSPGKTLITFSLGNIIKETIEVTIFRYDVTSFTINASKNEVKVGETINLNIDINPSLYIKDITYEILEGNDLIEINNHTIKGIKPGKVTLKGECYGVYSNLITFNVYNFDIEMEKTSLKLGEHERINVKNYIDGNVTDLKWFIENEDIGFIILNAVGDFYFDTSKVGSTKIWFYDDKGNISNYLNVIVNEGNPYENISKEEFYNNYISATSYQDSVFRSELNLMSGDIIVPDQAPKIALNQPKYEDKLIHNNKLNYSNDNKTYTVVDVNGNDAFEIYYGAAYVTLEEVAAYIYAWGDVPINYTASKKTKPTASPWKEYLRVNNNMFSGDTSKYPFEPVLPDISGCGGNLTYYEVDIGTTGTDCDPYYPARIYNDGTSIDRGAARIVYSRYYEGTTDPVRKEDRYVFYTFNHYNDFQEYLNYENGWGTIFGNITGGGTLSSKNPSLCNPTPYIPSYRTSLN